MFDFTNDAASTGFEAIPAGTYIVQIDSAEVKETKERTGKFFNLKLKVTGGEFKGRVIFHRMNFENKSPKAQEIGRGQVKAMLQAAGRTDFNLQSVTDLVGLTFAAKVGTEKNQNDEVVNNVKGFLSMDSRVEKDATTSARPF